MGAGCYYTHSFVESDGRNPVQYWIQLPRDDEDLDSDDREMVLDDLMYEVKVFMKKLNYTLMDVGGYRWRNGLCEIEFKPTYYGDGMLIDITPLADLCYGYENLRNLFNANWRGMEDKIVRMFHKNGYELRFGTSGYTSGRYDPS